MVTFWDVLLFVNCKVPFLFENLKLKNRNVTFSSGVSSRSHLSKTLDLSCTVHLQLQ